MVFLTIVRIHDRTCLDSDEREVSMLKLRAHVPVFRWVAYQEFGFQSDGGCCTSRL